MDGNCLICEGSLSVGETCHIGSKGLASLLTVSRQRQDNLESKFASNPELVLHTDCRKRYTRPSSIKASITSRGTVDENVATTSQTRGSSEKVFDFETDCLFCGKDASIGIKLERKYRKTVTVKRLTYKGQ